MPAALSPPNQAAAVPGESLGRQVRRAAIWRSGSQLVAQLVQWTATFAVIRILNPADYGLFAMTQVVLLILNMVNGYGLASALVRQPAITDREVRQLFGLLLAINGALAVAQWLLAPAFAAYYHQPQVAHLLRAQSLLYLATPFVALPQALLSRGMEFSRQAKVNIVASIVAAATALGGALAGWGVWTLVWAPIALFATRGVGLTIAAGGLVRPIFDPRGAGAFLRYGGLVAASQFFALIWTQADVFIAGRTWSPHWLGIYSTSLFLTQIFVSKIVPPLNEVAFAAYARLQGEADAIPRAFLKLARIVTALGLPFALGMAAAAEPLVLTVLGRHWAEAAPVVRMLGLAMPFYIVFVLFGPATDALGRPGLSTRNQATAALLAAPLLLVTVHWGVLALAATWLLVFPALLVLGARRSLPVIGVSAGALAKAVTPQALAAAAMAAAVALLDHLLPPLTSLPRLALLVSAGGAIYGGWLLLFARPLVAELRALLKR